MKKIMHIVVCAFLCLNYSIAQELAPKFQDSFTLKELVEAIENSSDYFCSYNSQLLEDNLDFINTTKKRDLFTLLDYIDTFYPFDIQIQKENNKIIFLKSETFLAQGVIVDSRSEETMTDVLVYGDQSNSVCYSNSDGFFSLSLSIKDKVLGFNQLGYKNVKYKLADIYGGRLIIMLEANNSIGDILILDTPKDGLPLVPTYKHRQEDIAVSLGINGKSDLMGYLKTMPSVSVGSEGQNGLNVRGGGQDQNLILIDGFQLYEASHLGGLSSVFLTESIKNVNFYSSAIPARFGGKLSSVIDVRLNDGNRNAREHMVSIGIEGIQGKMEGPLSENTSFSFNGKQSWFSELAKPLLAEGLDITDPKLYYNDLYGKVTHWFSPSNRISLTGYLGSDFVKLERQIDEEPAVISDVNKINWGNNLLGLQWNFDLSDKMFLSNKLGFTKFNSESRGSYEINFNNENEELESTSLAIVTQSDLTDLSYGSQLDYYDSGFGKFTFGTNLVLHRNSPSIFEEEIFITPETTISRFDSIYKSTEWNVFAENKLNLADNLTLNTGLRYNQFATEESVFKALNPRINLSYQYKSHGISASYSKFNQFIHLLANPGPGLPSELWIPSTDKLKPQMSNNFDLGYRYQKKDFFAGVNVYYKTFDNLIEYSASTDILYSFIINTSLYQVEADNISWEDRVSVGDGEAYGIEFQVVKQFEKVKMGASYALSKSTRSFDDIDNGDNFEYKFDRRHNLSSYLIYTINKKNTVQFNFAYGTGNAYTFATRQDPGGDDFPPTVYAPYRNNERVPNFHHLDVNYQRKIEVKDNLLVLSLGLYNAYNRKNPFYVYFVQTSFSAQPEAYKLSIYPILPQLNVSYTW